jgi:hypothetical protein
MIKTYRLDIDLTGTKMGDDESIGPIEFKDSLFSMLAAATLAGERCVRAGPLDKNHRRIYFPAAASCPLVSIFLVTSSLPELPHEMERSSKIP